MALIPWIIILSLSTRAVGRLVVDNKEELMIIDVEGRKSLDLMRIVREGDKVRATVGESECPGVMEETAEYEYVTIEEGEEEKHSVEITRVLDSITLQIVHNDVFPWVVGKVKMR